MPDKDYDHQDSVPWDRLKHLDLEGTPLRCSCHISWMLRLANQFSLFSHPPSSYSPSDGSFYFCLDVGVDDDQNIDNADEDDYG